MAVLVGDAKQYMPNDKLQPADSEGIKQFQPISRDWIEIVKDMSAAANGVITFSDPNFIVSEYFMKGDKIWLIQAGSDKYSYVIDADATTVTLYDVNITADPIMRLYSSRLTNPSDHPLVFTYDPIIGSDYSASGSMTVEDVLFDNLQVFVVGIRVNLSGGIENVEFGGVASDEFYVNLPIPVNVNYVNNFVTAYGIVDGAPEHLVVTTDSVNQRLVIKRFDGSNFVTGADKLSSYINIDYQI